MKTIHQEQIPIDIVFFHSTPLLHAMDNRLRWSGHGPLCRRRLCDQIDTLTQICYSNTEHPSQYKKTKDTTRANFINFRDKYEFQFISVAASHHEGNTYIERPRRTVGSYSDRLAFSKPRSDPIILIGAGSFYKKKAWETRKAHFSKR